MANPGNRHCANCIGTLSFGMGRERRLAGASALHERANVREAADVTVVLGQTAAESHPTELGSVDDDDRQLVRVLRAAVGHKRLPFADVTHLRHTYITSRAGNRRRR